MIGISVNSLLNFNKNNAGKRSSTIQGILGHFNSYEIEVFEKSSLEVNAGKRI